MRKRTSKRGFTLIEVIIDAFVITVVFGALISSFLVVLKTVDAGQTRNNASSLANEKMEKLRNLSYDALSTQHGTILPQGNILDDEVVQRGDIKYNVHTAIITVDDPFDGCAIPNNGQFVCTDGSTSSQQDFVPVDYKRISVTITQVGKPTIILATLSSNAAAKAAETPTNTGILLVTVNNSQGTPIENTTVTITDATTNTNVVGTTNAQGYIFIANVTPDSATGYHIVATKTGYSSDYTTARTNQNQTQPDVFVYAQQITTQTLAIDLLSTMSVTVTNETGAPVSGVQISATGEKTTQTNPVIAKNTYQQTTNAQGVATFSNVEWDSYALTVPSGYYVLTTSPYQDIALEPQANLAVTMAVSTNSAWPRITAVNPNSGTTGSSVQVVITGNNYGATATVLLRLAGQSDVQPTTVTVDSATQITATFDLTNVVAGSWDLVVTSNGQSITQSGGFIIS